MTASTVTVTGACLQLPLNQQSGIHRHMMCVIQLFY